jgi:hypothetical protein
MFISFFFSVATMKNSVLMFKMLCQIVSLSNYNDEDEEGEEGNNAKCLAIQG